MNDIKILLEKLNLGEIAISDLPKDSIFLIASCMILENIPGPDEILTQLTPLQRDLIGLQGLLMEGDVANASLTSSELLKRSRSSEERDLECEVRIRMERALLALDGPEVSGAELRWCAERLNAIAPQSALHGIAMLNQATWHSNRGEVMMALAIHAEITKESGFPNEIRGLSRLEVGRIMLSMEDLDSAMRHLWTARELFLESNMEAESLVASLEWLDIALEEVVDDAPRMAVRIENAQPRSSPGSDWIPSNKLDVVELIENIMPILSRDVSGTERNDLGMIIDAAIMLNKQNWIEEIRTKKDKIQDERLLDALQS